MSTDTALVSKMTYVADDPELVAACSRRTDRLKKATAPEIPPEGNTLKNERLLTFWKLMTDMFNNISQSDYS